MVEVEAPLTCSLRVPQSREVHTYLMTSNEAADSVERVHLHPVMHYAMVTRFASHPLVQAVFAYILFVEDQSEDS